MPNSSNNATGPEHGPDEEAAAPEQADGGPGSHSEGGSGGATNDPASGGVPEGADDDE